jgi:AraC-like DNA-binding protein
MMRIDRKGLVRVLEAFHALTGFRVGVFDRSGRAVCEAPTALSEFCGTLRRSPEAAARCGRCDREAFRRAAESGRFMVYRCHAGLVEALGPLEQDGERIGYLMVGQLVPRSEDGNPWRYTATALQAAGVPAEPLQPLFERLAGLDPERIRAACTVLEVLAPQLVRSGLVRNARSSTQETLAATLAASLPEGGRVRAIARRAGVGRTTLYKLSHRTFGVPVAARVKALRLEEAKRRLADTDQRMSDIAAALGMGSPGSFARWFRAQTGTTPSAYRSAHR